MSGRRAVRSARRFRRPSPEVLEPRETVRTEGYFFLEVLLDFFAEDFFAFDFPDFAAMGLTFFAELTRRRNRCFSTGPFTMQAMAGNVNDR